MGHNARYVTVAKRLACRANEQEREDEQWPSRKAERLGRTWTVYALIDPRDGLPFYIGSSVMLANRLAGHQSDPGSAAWPTMQYLKELGLKPRVDVFASFPSKREAWNYEHTLIREYSELLFNTHQFPANRQMVA